MSQGISIDIGTSGIRGQLLDLQRKKVVRTCIMSHNPLPGANVMDHLDFAMERGPALAHEILVGAVRRLIEALRADRLERIAVCGNPIQLSLFEGIEVRDLAFAGENKLRSQGITSPDRSGHIVSGDAIGLGKCVDVIIPPAIRHEIGADALAMMYKSGFLDSDMCMVTDYGTNAEMALKVGDEVFTGSAAAGPAIEGQSITAGMLASPGAISDLVQTPEGWRTMVLDERLEPQEGALISLRGNTMKSRGRRAEGITGTGVIALVYAGLVSERIALPHITGGDIMLDRGIRFNGADLMEAGKAIGAIRAGHLTLMDRAGMDPSMLGTMYMAGASGTYVDAAKAWSVGMVPASARRIVQIGNTSLELAKDLAIDPGLIDHLNDIRERLLAHHVMFASSPVFSNIYVQELAYWTEGMSWERYLRNLDLADIRVPTARCPAPEIERQRRTDIWDIGGSLTTIEPSIHLSGSWDCDRCRQCIRACPEGAISFRDDKFIIDAGRCLGTACRRCEGACPRQVFSYASMGLERTS
ncbi:methyltransferase [Methanomassiliicoccales archaeon RumEn M1]|jgi:methylamine methyltransferase corrinoid activation protein|nr:methyltransferase [Methanomassiliicoccales archaeon RumEn M1]